MKKYPLKRIIFIIAFTTLLIYSNIIYFNEGTTLKQPFMVQNGVECGIVLSNFTEVVNIKHGTNTEYYLKIKYNDRTTIEKVTRQHISVFLLLKIICWVFDVKFVL